MLAQLTTQSQNPRIINPNFKVPSNSLSLFNIPAALQPYIEFTLKSRDAQCMEQYITMLVQRLNIPKENHGESFFVDLVRYCIGCEQYELKLRLVLTTTCLMQVKNSFWLSQVMISIFYEWITYDSFIPEEANRLQLGWALISQTEEPKLAIQCLDFLLSLAKQFCPGNGNTERSVRYAFQYFRGHLQIFTSNLAQLDQKLAQNLIKFLQKPPQMRQNQTKKAGPEVSPNRPLFKDHQSVIQQEERKSILADLNIKLRGALSSKEKFSRFLDQLIQSQRNLEKEQLRLIASQFNKAKQWTQQISFAKILERSSQYLNEPSTALFDMIFNKSDRKSQRQFLCIQRLFCFLVQDQGSLCSQLFIYSLIRAKKIQKREIGRLCIKVTQQMIHSAKRNTKEIIKSIIQELVDGYFFKAFDSFILLLAQTQPEICTDFDIFLNSLLEYASQPTLIHIAFLIKVGELSLFEKTLLSVMKHSLKLSSFQQQHLWQLINAHHTGNLKIKDDLLKCVVHILSSQIIMEDETPEKAAIFTLNAVTLIEKFRRQRGKTFSLQAISDMKSSFPLFYQAIKLIIS